jgi:hypothetical protein
VFPKIWEVIDLFSCNRRPIRQNPSTARPALPLIPVGSNFTRRRQRPGRSAGTSDMIQSAASAKSVTMASGSIGAGSR